MENHRLARGAILILLSSILYNASGNRQQTQLLNLEEDVLNLQAECVSIRKDLRLERIDRQNMIDSLNQTLYQCTGDCKGTGVKEKAPHILKESLGKASDASDVNDSYSIQVLRRSFQAEKVKRRELENKLADIEHKYSTLVNTVNTFEENIRRLPKHDYDVALSKLRDVETKLESRVGILEKKFAELASKVENLTRFEDKHSAGNSIFHDDIYKLMSGPTILIMTSSGGATSSLQTYCSGSGYMKLRKYNMKEEMNVYLEFTQSQLTEVQSFTGSPALVHKEIDPLTSQPDSSCHVENHCTNPQFPADPCAVILSRAEWGARVSRSVRLMNRAVSIVFIHHTVTPRCVLTSICSKEVKKIQNYHMDTKGWDDIGYSFVVGEDGWAYEARGWDRVGAHTYGWNDVAISIAVLGNFNTDLPSEYALQAINSLIKCGLREGKLKQDYKLYGQRDATPTDSPGHMLYNLIKTWPHYKNQLPVRDNK